MILLYFTINPRVSDFICTYLPDPINLVLCLRIRRDALGLVESGLQYSPCFAGPQTVCGNVCVCNRSMPDLASLYIKKPVLTNLVCDSCGLVHRSGCRLGHLMVNVVPLRQTAVHFGPVRPIETKKNTLFNPPDIL